MTDNSVQNFEIVNLKELYKLDKELK
jgi:hypothetical protein